MKKRIIGLALAAILILSPFTYAFANNDTMFKATENQATNEQEIAKIKGFSSSQIDALLDKGFIYEEILKMSKEEVGRVLTQDLESNEVLEYQAAINSSSASTKATAPSGYTCVASVPDGGGSYEWFHPNTNTTGRDKFLMDLSLLYTFKC